MKGRIYIFVLLVLLLAALPELALAASPSDLASVGCADQSQAIAYPSADIAGDSAYCSVVYAIPYPAADFDGDGISSFVRPATIDAPTDLAEETGLRRIYGYGTSFDVRTDQADRGVTVNSVQMELRRTYGYD
jgi:hypothetical protein